MLLIIISSLQKMANKAVHRTVLRCHAPCSRFARWHGSRHRSPVDDLGRLGHNASIPVKLLALSFFVLLNLATSLPLDAGELTPATVAARLVKDEGYQFFTFHSKAAQPYQIVALFNGAENVQNTLDLPAWREFIVAVRLGKNHTLEAMRVYSDTASMSMVFPSGHFPEFNNVVSQAKIQIGDPFLTLKGARGELQLVLRPRKE
jgi:hypothetical protein